MSAGGLAIHCEYTEVGFSRYNRKLKDAKARAGCASTPPDVLMKVLSGSIAVSLSLCQIQYQPKYC